MATDSSTPWIPVTLPYFRSPNATVLPSVEEVRSCSNLIHERHLAKVVAVSDQIAVKFGNAVDLAEGQALIYLERYVPDVPAPRLHAMYKDDNQKFLVMDLVPGERLDRVWPSLTTSEKGSITVRLRQIFDSLRQAESPQPNFFGGVAGDGVHHYLFYSQKGDQTFLGPFQDEAAFVEGLTQTFRTSVERNGYPTFKVSLYENHLAEVLRNHRPTLTHGDVHRRNIMVAERKDYSPHGTERCFDVVLVDWEMAGWLPEFWEYYCTHMASQYIGIDDDWRYHAEKFLPVWLAETATMRILDKEMEG